MSARSRAREKGAGDQGAGPGGRARALCPENRVSQAPGSESVRAEAGQALRSAVAVARLALRTS